MELIAQQLRVSKLFLFGCFVKILCIFIFAQDLAHNSTIINGLCFSLKSCDQYISAYETSIYFNKIFSNTLLVCIADIMTLIILMKLAPNYQKNILILYWLSPIVLLQGYILNTPNLMPISLLFLSIYFLNNHKFLLSAILLTLSIAINLAMIYLAPFIIIYLFQQKRIYEKLLLYFLTLFISSVFILFLLYFAINYTSLSFDWLPIIMGMSDVIYTSNVNFLIMPFFILYILSLYFFFRLKRTNHSELICAIGVICLFFCLVTGNVDLWFLAAQPFIILYAAKTTNTGRGIICAAQLIITFYFAYIAFPVFKNVVPVSNEIKIVT